MLFLAQPCSFCMQMIVLIVHSVSVLQKLLLACDNELINATDMVINVTKSNCVRMGRRHKVICAELTTNDGDKLQWNF